MCLLPFLSFGGNKCEGLQVQEAGKSSPHNGSRDTQPSHTSVSYSDLGFAAPTAAARVLCDRAAGFLAYSRESCDFSDMPFKEDAFRRPPDFSCTTHTVLHFLGQELRAPKELT